MKLLHAFNAAIQPIKVIASDLTFDKAVVGPITDQDYQNFKTQILNKPCKTFKAAHIGSQRFPWLELQDEHLLSPLLLNRLLKEYPNVNYIIFDNCTHLTPDFLKITPARFSTIC